MYFPIVLPYITHIFNACITSSFFPTLWKYARVTPVPKKVGSRGCVWTDQYISSRFEALWVVTVRTNCKPLSFAKSDWHIRRGFERRLLTLLYCLISQRLSIRLIFCHKLTTGFRFHRSARPTAIILDYLCGRHFSVLFPPFPRQIYPLRPACLRRVRYWSAAILSVDQRFAFCPMY